MLDSVMIVGKKKKERKIAEKMESVVTYREFMGQSVQTLLYKNRQRRATRSNFFIIPIAFYNLRGKT